MLWLARRLSRPAKLLRPLFLVEPPSNNGLYSLSPLLLPCSSESKAQGPSPLPLASLRGGCYVDEASHPPPALPLCAGCGVHMQDSDAALPGFFSRPSPKSPDYHARLRPLPSAPDDPQLSLSLKSGLLSHEISTPDSDPIPEPEAKPLVCARCHSLRHYGRVKDPSAEDLLPDFDFDRMVAPKMASPAGPRSVVLAVVDAADFDGSFPRRVARLVSASIERHSASWKEGKPGNVPRVVLVVTKLDLLPSAALSPDALERWARARAHVGGAVKLAGVHLVSAVRNWGVRELAEHVRELVGPRGNVWAVGAQNAGKSTLINAMGRLVGGKVSHLTEAPVPGTTLGIVRVEGVLGRQAKLFDTPGILHPYQITTRLTREEQKLVHISKELRPRTYRIKAGYSVHIGGLMRVDLEDSPVETIYLTVWASPLLPLHMGKMENASTMIEDHFGRQLQPPIGEERVGELGKWVRKEFTVRGDSWDVSSIDIAAAGLGWVAVGLKGEALLGVWTYDGVDVVSRNSLIDKRARIFEDAGFTVSKIVSQADSALNKPKHNKPEKEKSTRRMKQSIEGTLTSDTGMGA